MKGFPFEPGRVVLSKAGRDEGRAMIVYTVQDASYVLVVDGDLRKLSSPKKKKVRHLRATPVCLTELAERWGQKGFVDADIRKALQECGYPGNCIGEEG